MKRDIFMRDIKISYSIFFLIPKSFISEHFHSHRTQYFFKALVLFCVLKHDTFLIECENPFLRV